MRKGYRMSMGGNSKENMIITTFRMLTAEFGKGRRIIIGREREKCARVPGSRES